MATLIENNTEELREILQTVNALPTAGSGGGGSSSISVIDLRELGFPYVTGPGYSEAVEFDQTTWDAIKSMIEYGVVKIKFSTPDGITGTETFLCTIIEGNGIVTYQAHMEMGNLRYTFALSPGNGVYGADFYITGS